MEQTEESTEEENVSVYAGGRLGPLGTGDRFVPLNSTEIDSTDEENKSDTETNTTDSSSMEEYSYNEKCQGRLGPAGMAAPFVPEDCIPSDSIEHDSIEQDSICTAQEVATYTVNNTMHANMSASASELPVVKQFLRQKVYKTYTMHKYYYVNKEAYADTTFHNMSHDETKSRFSACSFSQKKITKT